jgi:hypothetical protein
MKRIIIPVLSTMLLLNYTTGISQEKGNNDRKRYEFFKERSISKTYPAAGNQLSIENSFGHVKFLTWDKNEIRVDIHIESSSNKQEVAQQTFDAINVTDKQQGNEISFVTKINDKKNGCKDCKTSFHIDYEVHLPASVALSVENNFGNTELPDYSGTVSLVSKFGKLTTGNLSAAKKLSVEFGSANIRSLTDIDASFKFSKVEIEKLTGKNKINLEFCDATKISFDKGLSALTLHESYSNVNIRPGNADASYSVATSFGSFTDRTNTGVKRTDSPDKYGPDANKTFEGGNGAVKVNITSSFGRIILGEATADDMKGKDKSKNKKKDRVVHL